MNIAADKSITLRISSCDQGLSYLATWEGPDAEGACLRFLRDRVSTHDFREPDDRPIDYDRHPELADFLYPTCEHGLTAANCYGPQHYYFDEEEQAAGRLNGW